MIVLTSLFSLINIFHLLDFLHKLLLIYQGDFSLEIEAMHSFDFLFYAFVHQHVLLHDAFPHEKR